MQSPDWTVNSNHFAKVGWGQAMDGLKDKPEDFELRSELHWKPVEGAEDRCDVGVLGGA